MSNKKTKMINRIKKAIAPLTPVLLRDIPRPQTVEEGRANLKRFYGCMDNYLIVLLRNEDRQGNPINLPTGEWINGKWVYWYSNENHFDIPHDAIHRIIRGKNHFLVWVDPNKMSNLYDLYKITKSLYFFSARSNK